MFYETSSCVRLSTSRALHRVTALCFNLHGTLQNLKHWHVDRLFDDQFRDALLHDLLENDLSSPQGSPSRSATREMTICCTRSCERRSRLPQFPIMICGTKSSTFGSSVRGRTRSFGTNLVTPTLFDQITLEHWQVDNRFDVILRSAPRYLSGRDISLGNGLKNVHSLSHELRTDTPLTITCKFCGTSTSTHCSTDPTDTADPFKIRDSGA